jgi:hypothetical protein
MKTRKIENPIPFLTEAADAARTYLSVRREHLVLSAEIRAKLEAKRALYGVLALVFAVITLLLFFFWITNEIHEAGVPSWGVALITLAFLGAVAGVFAYLAKETGRADSRSLRSTADDSERRLAG